MDHINTQCLAAATDLVVAQWAFWCRRCWVSVWLTMWTTAGATSRSASPCPPVSRRAACRVLPVWLLWPPRLIQGTACSCALALDVVHRSSCPCRQLAAPIRARAYPARYHLRSAAAGVRVDDSGLAALPRAPAEAQGGPRRAHGTDPSIASAFAPGCAAAASLRWTLLFAMCCVANCVRANHRSSACGPALQPLQMCPRFCCVSLILCLPRVCSNCATRRPRSTSTRRSRPWRTKSRWVWSTF